MAQDTRGSRQTIQWAVNKEQVNKLLENGQFLISTCPAAIGHQQQPRVTQVGLVAICRASTHIIGILENLEIRGCHKETCIGFEFWLGDLKRG
jgi:hypothetical protein